MFKNCFKFAKYSNTLDRILYKQALYKGCTFLKHLYFSFLFLMPYYKTNKIIYK